MKKTSILLSMILLLTVTLVGCGGGEAKETPAADTVAQAVLDNVAFRDSLVKAEGDVAENYYKLDDTIAEHAIYISGSGATAEEIAVLKVSDAKNIDGAKAVLDKRIEEQKRRFESYVPGEMVKLEDPVIVTQGDIAILVLSDDNAAAETAIKDALQ